MNADARRRIVYIEDDPEMVDLVTIILNRRVLKYPMPNSS